MDVVDLRNFYAQRLGTVARRFVGRGIRARWTDTDAPARPRYRLRHALSRLVPRRGRTLPCADAGAARRRALALVKPGACRAGRGRRLAAHRLGGRPRAARPCARELVRSGRAVARSLAGAVRRRPAARGGAEPARAVGAHGHDAVRPRPPLFAFADHASVARDLVHADRPGARRFTCRRSRRGWFLRSAVAWERAGSTLSAPFAGVHIVEATKQVYRAIPTRRERRRLVPVLQPVLGADARRGGRRCRWSRGKETRSDRGHGSAVTAAASAPINSARLSKRCALERADQRRFDLGDEARARETPAPNKAGTASRRRGPWRAQPAPESMPPTPISGNTPSTRT